MGSFSVNSCTFALPVGGGELKVFLLCHLGQSSSGLSSSESCFPKVVIRNLLSQNPLQVGCSM